MPTLEDVTKAKQAARDFYKSGTKSVNKYYAKQSEAT